MKVEILGRHIEIDDAKVAKIFNEKYERNKHLDINKEEFIQRCLDYFEFNLEYNILLALDHNLGSAVSVLVDIAEYKYSESVSPFNKPMREIKPTMIPPRGLTNHQAKFLSNLGLTKDRDDKLVAEIYKAIDEKEKLKQEEARKRYEAKWKGWPHMMKR